MTQAKPNPRLSEILEARAVMQAAIRKATQDAMGAFTATTGLIPSNVDIILLNHTTGEMVHGVSVVDVNVSWVTP